MIGGLVAVLSQAGKLYAPSALGIVIGVSVWTAALVGGILLLCARMDREVTRIRIVTHTTDEDYATIFAARGKTLLRPRFFESKSRLFGLPVFAMAWGGQRPAENTSRQACAWIALGDIAISPFLAVGGVAIAPVAVGAISVGVLSLSVFWGVAVGVFALGSLAFGWWAIGCAAAGVKCAIGFAAVARDYALGLAASATESGTVAKDWIATQGFVDFKHVMIHHAPWWILCAIVMVVFLREWRRRGM
jgi:hypothetical protein